jgi:hypothetical protein
MKVCTLPGTGRPFCATVLARASGCQLFGSGISVPASSTTSGALAGLYSGARYRKASWAPSLRPYAITSAAMRFPSAAGESPSVVV